MNYQFLEAAIAIEFILVAGIVILVYVLKLIYMFRNREREQVFDKLYDYIEKKIDLGADIQVNDLKYLHQQQLDIIIKVIKYIDNVVSSLAWQKIRKDLLEKVMLPLARKASKNSHWTKRFFAAEAFILCFQPGDEIYITKLTEDDIPMVYINALKAALKWDVEEGILHIIKRMSLERRITQSIYLQAFEHAPFKTSKTVISALNVNDDPYTRASIYNILLRYKPVEVTWDLDADLNSATKELRLAAIRFYTHIYGRDGLNYLLELTSDPVWEVKVVAIQSLANLKNPQSITHLARLLRDPVWWVRLNAAQALKQIGKQGVDVLKSQDPDVDLYAYEAANHVLSIP